MTKKISLPFDSKTLENLHAGDEVEITGVIYTARDAAHKRMCEFGKIPFEIKDAVIYYTGPTPARPGKIIGSCGPTTSYRMDPFTPYLLSKGLKGIIGKGKRSEDVRVALKKYKGVYFIAPGGCGALLSSCVKSAKVIAYPELLSEAIYKLEVKDFPVIVGIDMYGKNI